MALLALKDSDHVVRKNSYELHKRANITLEEVESGLEALSKPDKKRPGQEHGGRRIEKVEDGWLILNGAAYEDMMRKLNRREYKRTWQRQYRLNGPSSEKNKLRQMGAIEKAVHGSSTMAARLYAEAEAAGDKGTMKRMEEMQAGAPTAEEADELERQAEGNDSPI